MMNVVRALIVAEDNIAARRMKRALGEWGYSVVGIYASGQEAIASVKKDEPDLVLMCIELHDSKSIKTAQLMKSQVGVPIIHIYFSAAGMLQCTNANTAMPIKYENATY